MLSLVQCIARSLSNLHRLWLGEGVPVRKYLLGGLLLLASSTGCRMCCCPYDDCYPVVESYGAHGGAPAEEGPVEYQDDGQAPMEAPAVEEQQSMRPSAAPHLANPRHAPQQQTY